MSIRLPAIFRAFDGPMTRELVLSPGEFGLGKMPRNAQAVAVARSICGFCSTGCGLKIHLDAEGEAVSLTPDPAYPVNIGMACPKGWEALTPLAAPDRATTPLINGRPADWPAALDEFTGRFRGIMDRHGAESCAFLSTGQIMCEEMAFLGMLAKAGMGMVHGDGNTRQCMATSAVAYKESFGFDAPPYTYQDFEISDVIVFIGANPCIAHPIMWQRVERNPFHPEIIVIDPRTTETAAAATQHLALQPKSDLVLLYCLANELIREGAVRREFVNAHTTGFDAFAEFVKDFAPEQRLAETGISPEVFGKAARAIAAGKRVSFWWTMGVNQGHEAVRTAQAIINLALMTGNIGRPGTGANSITGQCNAMGSRLFSSTTNLLGGHDFTKAEHRAKIAGATGIPEAMIPSRPSLAYDQIIAGIESGQIRALWMIATNGAHSWIQQKRFRELVEKLEFFVVQDMYATTETAQMAHLFLPAAGWGEKEGTFINSERRFGVSHKVARAPGAALADFHIFQLIAEAWGVSDSFTRWTSPEAVFQIMKEASRGQPCDITGIRDFAMIEAHGGIQWPWAEVAGPAGGAAGTGRGPGPEPQRRLFADGRFFTPDGRAKFIFESPRPVPEPADAEYPFVLLTGRGTSAQWHTGSRTDKSAILNRLHPDKLCADIHPDDAMLLGLRDGDLLQITSRRASITAAARVTSAVSPGQIFLPMHGAEVNRLTKWEVDPYSRQPSYKHCAVKISRG